MKAIVLAAGKGTRLGEVGRQIPKPMLRVGGRPVLEQNLEWLRSSGVDEVVINLHHLGGAIRRYFGNGSHWGLKISYSPESELLGTAGAVRRIHDAAFFGRRFPEDVLVVYGDNLYPISYRLDRMMEFHLSKGGFFTIGLYRNPAEIYKSGLAFLDRWGKIKHFLEKPGASGAGVASSVVEGFPALGKGWINTGVYVMKREAVRWLPTGFSDFGRDIFPRLLARGTPLYGYRFSGRLMALDTIEHYRRATA